MNRRLALITLLIILLTATLTLAQEMTPTLVETPTETPTSTVTPSETSTETATSTPSETLTATASGTSTVTETSTETATSTVTPSTTATYMPTSTDVEELIATPILQIPNVIAEDGGMASIQSLSVNPQTYVGAQFAIISAEDVSDFAALPPFQQGTGCTTTTPAYEIYLLDGVFTLDRTIVVYCNTIIYGRGASRTSTLATPTPIPPMTGSNTYITQTNNPNMKGMLWVFNGARLDLRNLTLYDGYTNTGGGAVYVTESSTLITSDTIFQSNYADGSGGAVYLYPGTRYEFARTEFIDNSAGDSGGAITSFGTTSNITTLIGTCGTFLNNATNASGSEGQNGGAIWLQYNSAQIFNSVFENNRAFGVIASFIGNHIFRFYGSSVSALNNFWTLPSVSSNPGGSIFVSPMLTERPNNCAMHTPVPVRPTPTPTQVNPLSNVADCNTLSQSTIIGQLEATYQFIIAQSTLIVESEVRASCRSVINTANALKFFADVISGGPTYESSADAFINIMLGSPDASITYSNTTDTNLVGAGNCKTGPTTIVCGEQNVLSEYTMTHELGHVFLYRTANGIPQTGTTITPCPLTAGGVGFIGCMDDPNLPNADPNSNAAKALRGAESETQFVFGVITRRLRPNVIQNRIDNFDPTNQYGVTSINFPATICQDGTQAPCEVNGTPEPPVFAEITDWERGLTGWDIPIEINAPDRFGACGNASGSYVITNFQQNPCVIYEWVLEHPSATNVGDVGTLKTTEQEEAGADMFLNWVYRTVEGAPSQAFGHNGDTADIPTGRAFPECSVQIQGHGDDRFCWMQENLRLFFQYYGW